MVATSIHICHISYWRQSAVTASYQVWIDLENIQWPTEDQTMYTLYIMYIFIYTWLINAVTRWTLRCWMLRLNTVFQSSVITFIHTQSNWLKLQPGKCCSKIFSKWMDKTIHMHTTFNKRIAKPDSLFRINNIHDFIFIESYCLKKEKGTERLNTLGEYCQIGGRSAPPSPLLLACSTWS